MLRTCIISIKAENSYSSLWKPALIQCLTLALLSEPIAKQKTSKYQSVLKEMPLRKKICISGLPQSWSFLVHLARISAVTRDTNLNKMKHSGNTLMPPEAIICVSEELRHMDYTGRCFHFYPRDWCWQLRADPGSQQADVLSNSLGNFWLSFLSWHHYLELTASWPERCWIHEMQRSFQLTTPCKLYIALLFHVQPPKISEQFKDRNQVQNCDPYLTSVS